MCAHLHVELRLAVEEVKEPLIVEELGIPFLGLVISEVITQGHKEDTLRNSRDFFRYWSRSRAALETQMVTGPTGSHRLKNTREGAAEVAQGIKYLSHKHDGWSLDTLPSKM